MRIILYGLWLTTIVAGSILGTIVPPEASIVSVQTWRDGHIHFIEDSGEQYMEFFPQYIKDWCYLSDLMKLH